MTAKDLDALAKELRLTPKQRDFAERLAADVERNQTRAALAAGASPKSAPVTANKWLKLAKVQKYIGAIRKKAEDLVVRKTGRECASLEEALEILTYQARARTGEYIDETGDIDLDRVRAAPAGVIRSLDIEERWEGKGEKAQLIRTKKVRVDASQAAAIALVKYHSGGFAPQNAAAAPINLQVWMGVVQNSNGDFRGKALKVLSAAEVGGNGQPGAR